MARERISHLYAMVWVLALDLKQMDLVPYFFEPDVCLFFFGEKHLAAFSYYVDREMVGCAALAMGSRSQGNAYFYLAEVRG